MTAESQGHTNWDLVPLMADQDGDRIRDTLQQKASTNPSETVFLHLLYDRRPTTADLDLLQDSFGARQTYLFSNWDWIKVETIAGNVAAFLDAPGVIAIEEFVPPVIQNQEAKWSTRVKETATPTNDGYDHTLAVHEDLGLRGEGMVVAVLDTGVDNKHPMLDDLDDDVDTTDPKLLRKLDPTTGTVLFGGADASGGFAIVSCVDPIDDHLHGTHVAGTVVGTRGTDVLPLSDISGVAPQARLVDIDIAVPVGTGLLGGIVDPIGSAIGLGEDIAFDWLIDFNQGETCWGDPGEDRVDVATMSFGSGGSSASVTQNVGITDVVRSGITFTGSAGNSGDAANTLTTGAEGAIIVAASDDRATPSRADDFLADFSSRGPRPSDGDTDAFDELRPDIAAPGVNIASAAYHGQGLLVATASGTSMSTPHVAGIATLMLQAADAEGIDLRPIDVTGEWKGMGQTGAVPIRDLLQKTAQYRSDVQPGALPVQQTQVGKFGLPWNNGWGYGLVDAYSAVQLAKQRTTTEPRITITAPTDGAIVPAGLLTITGTVDRAGETTSTLALFGLSNDAAAVTDPSGDHTQAYMDIVAVDVQNDDADSFDVVLSVADMSGLPTNPVAAGFSFGVDLCPNNNLYADAPVCYRLSAGREATGDVFGNAVVNKNRSSCGYADLLVSGAFEPAQDRVRWTLPKSTLDFRVPPDDINDCQAVGPPLQGWTRGGAPVTDGTVISGITGNTGTRIGGTIPVTGGGASLTFGHGGALAVAQDDGIFGDTTGPGVYTVGGPISLSADAGGPYSGDVGVPIPIAGAFEHPTGVATCAWTSPDDAVFDDDQSCSTTVTFPTTGTMTLTLTVTDETTSAQDTALVDVGETAATERVEFLLGETTLGVVEVATSTASPSADFSSNVDTGELEGSVELTARWLEADGTLLDEEIVTVNIEASVNAILTITSHEDGATVEPGATVVGGDVQRGGETGTPLTADAAGPYMGIVDEPIAISGSGAGGSGTYECAWASATGGTLTDATACSTTITYPAAGDDTLTLTVTDGVSSAEATASVSIEERQAGASITITDPANGATLASPVTFAGTVSGIDGAATQQRGWFGYGALDPTALKHGGVIWEPWMERLRPTLEALDGFITGVPTMSEGRPTLFLLFRENAPPGVAEMVPATWQLEIVEHASPQRLQTPLPGGLDGLRSDSQNSPNGVLWNDFIGPGSQLAITFEGFDRAELPTDALFFGEGAPWLCTANYVFKDQQGRLYLGAAGHCFLDGATTTGTHGEDANFVVDPTKHRVYVCRSVCPLGGFAGNLHANSAALGPASDWVELGKIAYARQEEAGPSTADVGHDFGIVEIPPELYPFVSPEMPVWGGPTQYANPAVGDLFFIHGNGAVVAETFASKSRTGVYIPAALGLSENTATTWSAVTLSNGGDSGSAVGRLAPGAGVPVADGIEAAGLLTHGYGEPVTGALPTIPIALGTKITQAIAMARQAGLCIEPLLKGDDPETVEPVADCDLSDPDPVWSVTYSVDGSPAAPATVFDQAAGTWSVAATALEEGAHTVTANLMFGDVVESTATSTFTVDNPEGRMFCTTDPAGDAILVTDPDRLDPTDITNLCVEDQGTEMVFLLEISAADVQDLAGEAGSPLMYTVAFEGGQTFDMYKALGGWTVYRYPTAGDAAEGIVQDATVTVTGFAPAIVTLTLPATAIGGPRAALHAYTHAGEPVLGVSPNYILGDGAFHIDRVPDVGELGTQGSSTAWNLLRPTDQGFGPDPGQSAEHVALYLNGEFVGSDDVDTAADPFTSDWSIGATLVTGTNDLAAEWYDADGTLLATKGISLVGEAANVRPTAVIQGPSFWDEPTEVPLDGTASHDEDGTIVTFLWDFGDGETSNEPAPRHDFAPGSYVVTLTVTDDDGATGSVSHNLRVNERPVAMINAPATGARGSEITFDGRSSTDANGEIVSYTWDFGDGETGSGPVVSHVYSSLGTFTVTLTVEDDEGSTGQTTHDVEIANAAPEASIEGPTSIKKNKDATFTATASDPDGSIVSYQWDLGDGTTGTGTSVTHRYKNEGTYTIRFTVTDNEGSTATAEHVVTVGKEK